MTTSINGRVSTEVKQSFVGSFLLRPKHTGSLRIASHSFRVKGQIFQSDPQTLQVSAALKNERYQLRWSVPSPNLIEGQPLRLKLEFLYADQVRALNFSFPFLNNPDIVWDNPVAPSNQNQADLLAFQSGGRQWFGRKTTAERNGHRYNSVELLMTGHPQHTGAFRLEGFAADISAKTGVETVRDFFDREVQQDKYDDLSLLADPLLISVKALPDAGKPASYSGLVGRLSLVAKLPTNSVSLGDPIELSVSVAGLQNQVDPQNEIERQLTEASGLKVSLKDRKASDSAIDYTFFVRFTQAGSQAVEPIVLDYFDPQAGQYHQASTQRLAVQVRDATVMASNNVVGSWGTGANPVSQVPDRALYPDAQSSLPGLGMAVPPWCVPLLVITPWLIWQRWHDPQRRAKRQRRQRLRQLSELPEWDEARLLSLLPSDWDAQRTAFDRLRYSPPSPGRAAWLAEIQEYCRKELAR